MFFFYFRRLIFSVYLFLNMIIKEKTFPPSKEGTIFQNGSLRAFFQNGSLRAILAPLFLSAGYPSKTNGPPFVQIIDSNQILRNVM